MKVELFIPCYIDQFFPTTAFNTVKLLRKAGCEVIYNPNQTCCGKPAYTEGYWNEAKEVGAKFISEFSTANYIITPSTSCIEMVKVGFNDLFTNTIVHNQCRNLQNNIFELSDFLFNVTEKEYFGAELEGKAIFLDSFSSLSNSHNSNAALQLLSRVLGLELVEMNKSDSCCGFGGAFSIKFDAISSAIASEKINEALKLGADYIISTDYSCLMHLDSYIKKENIAIKTMHIADVLTHGWLENPEF